VAVDKDGLVRAQMVSGKRVQADALLYMVGRHSNADQVNLQAAGLSTDARGRITVNEHFQTAVPHIYAAGDCNGFPALALTSMEQGSLASNHMFESSDATMPQFFPHGIYTISEISMVGRTERELTGAKRKDERQDGNDRCALTLSGCTNCRVDNDSYSGLDPAGDLPQEHYSIRSCFINSSILDGHSSKADSYH